MRETMNVACPHCGQVHRVPTFKPFGNRHRKAAPAPITVRCLACGRDFETPPPPATPAAEK